MTRKHKECLLTDRWPVCNLTVGAVIQINFCCFVFLHFNTTAQKIHQLNNLQILQLLLGMMQLQPPLRLCSILKNKIKSLTFHGTSPDRCHTQS